jgi:Abnormal spindle-like microcephaly-assoc'd, ASPM-SPD-2-Hydin/CARDB
MKAILFSLATTCLPTFAVTVSHTFSGVTNFNPASASEINAEFPLGTKWTVQVEWDSAAAPLFASDTQGSYRLTKFTTTLQGKTGVWTTSSLPGKAGFTMGKYGSHEIQFTSGAGAGDHSNANIENLQPYSINVTLSDPTGKALSSLASAPSRIDMSQWDIEASEFKFYLSESGFSVILGNLQAAAKGPEISVRQGAGGELTDGSGNSNFGTVKRGKSSVKTFTIKNTGTKTLKNLEVSVGGKNKKDFTVKSLSKKTLAPGASTPFQVTFKPTANGSRKAAVVIKSNDKDENPFDIKLIGLGAP